MKRESVTDEELEKVSGGGERMSPVTSVNLELLNGIKSDMNNEKSEVETTPGTWINSPTHA